MKMDGRTDTMKEYRTAKEIKSPACAGLFNDYKTWVHPGVCPKSQGVLGQIYFY